MKPLVLATALALSAPLSSLAQAATTLTAETAPAPAWATQSNDTSC